MVGKWCGDMHVLVKGVYIESDGDSDAYPLKTSTLTLNSDGRKQLTEFVWNRNVKESTGAAGTG